MTQVVVVYHIAILKEHEAGMKTADLCGKPGISEGNVLQLEGNGGP